MPFGNARIAVVEHAGRRVRIDRAVLIVQERIEINQLPRPNRSDSNSIGSQRSPALMVRRLFTRNVSCI